MGVGHPLPGTGAFPEQLTGVGPPPMGVGHPLPGAGALPEQLTGVGPPPMGVGQPPADTGVITGVGVDGGVGTGKLA